METQTIEDVTLGTIVLEFDTVQLSLRQDDGGETHIEARVFFSPVINGGTNFDLALRLLDGESETANDEEEWVSNRDTRLLLWLHIAAPKVDTRRTRRFDPRTFEHSASLRELTRLTNTRTSTPFERIQAAIGDVKDSNLELLEEAIYEQPTFSLPFSQRAYEEFRDMYLSEVEVVVSEFDRIFMNVVAKARKDFEAEPITPNRREILDRFDRLEQGESPKEYTRGIRSALRLVLRAASRIEEERAQVFRDLVERLDALFEDIDQEAGRRGIPIPSQDAAVPPPEYVEVACAVSAGRAETLLNEFITRFEERCGASPEFFISDEEIGSYPTVEDVEDVEPPPQDAETENHADDQQYHAALTIARDNGDLFQMLCHMASVRDQLVNRSECHRLVHREAEMVYHRLLGYANRLIYRAIRHHLTPVERRLFKMMYLPHHELGGRVAMLDPVITSFVFDMDADTQAVTLWAVSAHGSPTRQHLLLKEELGRRWRTFLRFYPYWVEAVRSDERELRHERGPTARTVSLHDLLYDTAGGKSVERKDVCADHRCGPPDFDRALQAVLGENLAEFAAKYCTSAQVTALVGRFCDGKTETALAKEAGITQQAVSKRLKTGVEALRAGLIRDGYA